MILMSVVRKYFTKIAYLLWGYICVEPATSPKADTSAALNLLSFGLIVISNGPGRHMAYSVRFSYKTANNFCVKYFFIELIIAEKVTGDLFSCRHVPGTVTVLESLLLDLCVKVFRWLPWLSGNNSSFSCHIAQMHLKQSRPHKLFLDYFLISFYIEFKYQYHKVVFDIVSLLK
jgi:hypothetical protein